MTNEEFCKAHIGERVLYKGKDIGAYVAGYVEEKYIILGFNDYTGCISCFKLLFILFILGIFAYMGINDRSHKGKTFWYEVIDKRESVGSHFSIINKGVRTDYNIIFKRIDNGKLFPCKDVEYGDYIQYLLHHKYSITEEDMQELSGIYNRDFYK